MDASASYDPDNMSALNRGIVSYNWEILAESSNEVINWTSFAASAKKVMCVFPRDDAYKVTLRVTDADGNKSTIVKEIKVVLPDAYIKDGGDGASIIWQDVGDMVLPISMGGSYPTTNILYKDPDTASFLLWSHPAFYTCYPPRDKTYYVANPNDKTWSIEYFLAQRWDINPLPGWKVIGSYDTFDPVTFQMTRPLGVCTGDPGLYDYKV